MTRRAIAVPVGCDTGERVSIIVTVSLLIVHILQVLQQPGANRLPLQSLAGPCRAGAQVKGGKRRKPAEPGVDLRLIRWVSGRFNPWAITAAISRNAIPSSATA